MDNFTFFNRRGINVDLSHRCSLECLRCQRTRYYTSKKIKVPGEDLPLDEFKKILKHFNNINFCGQYSDPVHHPKFIEMLKMCKDYNKTAVVHNASSQKSEDWYIRAFQANEKARWVFGIDGLPKDSCLYRVNQDGEKLFNIMLMSKKYLKLLPIWQFIVFSYNEKYIEECKKLADKNNIMFLTLESSRWISDNDPLIPKNPNYVMKRK